MATEANKARRQAEAENVINTHVSALAGKFNVDVPEPYQVRDTEMKRLINLENLGEILGRIVEAVNENKEKTGEKEADKKEVRKR